MELGPHGDGWHGCIGTVGVAAAAIKYYIRFQVSYIQKYMFKNKLNLRIGAHLVKGSPV